MAAQTPAFRRVRTALDPTGPALAPPASKVPTHKKRLSQSFSAHVVYTAPRMAAQTGRPTLVRYNTTRSAMGTHASPHTMPPNQPEGTPASFSVPKSHSTLAIHKSLAAVPYCQVCREYLAEFIDRDQHEESGFLAKRKAFRVWRQRWFVLSGQHAAYYAAPEDVGRTLPKGVFHLERPTIIDEDPNKTVFSLQLDQLYTLRAPSIAEKKTWMARFRASDAPASFQRGVADNAFCIACRQYFDLDKFTLCDFDGWLTRQARESRTGDVTDTDRVWAVLVDQHLGIFESPECITSYTPLDVLHVTGVVQGHSNADEQTVEASVFSVTGDSTCGKSRTEIFRAEDAEAAGAWLAQLTPKST